MDQSGITIRVTVRTLVIVACLLVGGLVLWIAFGARIQGAFVPPPIAPLAVVSAATSVPTKLPAPTPTPKPTATFAPTVAPTNTLVPTFVPSVMPEPTATLVPTLVPSVAPEPTHMPPTPIQEVIPTPVPTATPIATLPPLPTPVTIDLTAIAISVQATMEAEPKVQYVVDGSAKRALMTYMLYGEIHQVKLNLPWKSNLFPGHDGIYFSISAQNQGTDSEVTCHILVDGKEDDTDTAFVDYGIADCQTTIGE